MRAKEFIVEYRDRLLQYVKSLLPTWPEYVLKDWLVPNKGNFSNLPTDAVKNGIMEKIQLANLSVNTKWQLVPNMKFTMGMFDPKTKQLLIGRAGGSSDLGMGIPRDKERHATQAALAQQQGGVHKEPVLLIKSANGYELLEGWHRTIQHFVKYPNGYTGPAYVAVAQGQQDIAEAFVTEDAMMGKLEDSGKIVRILKKAHTVPFSDEKNWLLIDTDPAKGNKGLGLKWVPADTRFTWVRPYRDSMEEGSDLQEIVTMPADQFAGGKDMLDYMPPPSKKRFRPLPGGTDLMYAIETMGPETRVQIVDPGVPGITRPVVVAVLNLDPSSLPNTVQVGSITVDEDYRGRGLAKSLYGIVLTIMRKNLVSGDSQTPGGRRNWLSLATIPGVEVRGLVRIPNQIFDVERTATVWRKYADRTMDQIMELGGQFYSKDGNSTYWLFDVVPGKTSLKPAVHNALSRLYGYESDNLLLATWTGA